MATFDEFLEFDIRSGVIMDAKVNAAARVPAYCLKIDFGDEIGIKQSSAQLCDHYTEVALVGMTIAAVVNFPPRRVAGFKSEVLLLAFVTTENTAVLVIPEMPVKKGLRLL